MLSKLFEHGWFAPALDGVAAALSDVGLVLAFRALPFVVYAVGRPNRPVLPKTVVLVLYGALLLVAGERSRSIIMWTVAGLAYYAFVAGVLHWISRSTSSIPLVDRALLFCFLLVVFLLVPATLLRPFALGTFQILGCDLTLKGYSYVVEKGGARTTLGSCLFFFLVDPSVVFVQRAKPLANGRIDSRAAARVGLGLLSMFVCFLAIAPLVGLIAMSRKSAVATDVVPLLIASGFVQLLAAYSLHSGLASIQLGLLRLCGHVAGERYNHPLLASSPADFWNRWNIYVGQWVKRYLYTPVALRLGRRYRTSTQAAAPWTVGLALLLAFVAIGAFHDLYSWSEEGRFTLVTTGFFAANAVFLALWTLVARARVARLATHSGGRDALLESWRRRGLVVERFAFGLGFASLIGMSW